MSTESPSVEHHLITFTNQVSFSLLTGNYNQEYVDESIK